MTEKKIADELQHGEITVNKDATPSDVNENRESEKSEDQSDADTPSRGKMVQVDGEGESGRSESQHGDSNIRRRRRRRRRGVPTSGRSQSHNQSQSRGRSRSRRPQVSGQNGQEISGTIDGVLELHPKGYGFLRDPQKNYAAQDIDAFVSSSVIEKYRLREGVLIRGEVGPGSKGQGPRLKAIATVDGLELEEYQNVKFFDDLTPVTPFEKISLETGPTPITMRVMDLLTPIGKGQRALLVAPPRTGKTMLLQEIANAVSTNHPEVDLIVLLIDERPEEVTEMRRTIKGEVVASSMDREIESHVRISQLIIERGKRLAEMGRDVFILMDSITRTARAFNKWIGNTGRTMTGGLDIKALEVPRKMFGTARRFDEGGSLTVTATALIDTGSRMDDAIFQEFKGTGNMELVLSRDLADRRIWPAIDITKSGTRHEEKLFSPDVMEGITMLRRSLISLSPVEAMEQLIRTLERFPTNVEFVEKIRSIL